MIDDGYYTVTAGDRTGTTGGGGGCMKTCVVMATKEGFSSGVRLWLEAD